MTKKKWEKKKKEKIEKKEKLENSEWRMKKILLLHCETR